MPAEGRHSLLDVAVLQPAGELRSSGQSHSTASIMLHSGGVRPCKIAAFCLCAGVSAPKGSGTGGNSFPRAML